ncbi:hypothetical protein MFIFM68171_07148 [Madurella fahalii]|uniref:Uncharacterized protein n=1 Tax=Madurella fahalii TaxID=1157608 RepID=A0ABQ0GGQ5_9PEZI
MPIGDTLRSQWQNPADVLSLLMLIGGDVVQKSIAQLFGFYLQPSPRFPRIYLTPVAFSFGWVAYAFVSLILAISDKQLMPSTPDTPSVVINARTGFSRTNNSWLLGRVLRDHELRIDACPGPLAARLSALNADRAELEHAGLEHHAPLRTSLRIDIFTDDGGQGTLPRVDRVWILGWATIVLQLAIAGLPWALYGDWAVFLVTAAGTLLALATGSLRQWALEKWPGRRLNPRPPSEAPVITDPETGAGAGAAHHLHPGPVPEAKTDSAGKKKCQCRPKPATKTICLTRGNGHLNVLVILGSAAAWDLETLATARSESCPETVWCLGIMAAAWVCLLISVAALEENTWFLVAVGGLGMVQNLYASSAPRSPESMGIALRMDKGRPTIIGSSTCESKFWYKGSSADGVSDETLMAEIRDPSEVVGVRGAIRELEKTIPRAGFALMPVFFPSLFRVDRERYRDDAEARFWQLKFEGGN